MGLSSGRSKFADSEDLLIETSRGTLTALLRSGFSALLIAFGHLDDRPLYLVLDPVLIRRLHDVGLMNDACLDPCVFRHGWMQRKYRRTTSAAKTPLDFSAAATHKPIAPHFRRRFHFQIFAINTDSNIEGAAIRFPAIFTVTIVRWTESAGITQMDSAAQA